MLDSNNWNYLTAETIPIIMHELDQPHLKMKIPTNDVFKQITDVELWPL